MEKIYKKIQKTGVENYQRKLFEFFLGWNFGLFLIVRLHLFKLLLFSLDKVLDASSFAFGNLK